jgi:hypothetical protein
MQKIFTPCKADTYAQKSLVVGTPFSHGSRKFVQGWKDSSMAMAKKWVWLWVVRSGFYYQLPHLTTKLTP